MDPLLERSINYIKNANKLLIQELKDGYLINYYFDDTDQNADGLYRYHFKNLHTGEDTEKYATLEEIGTLINNLMSRHDSDIYDIYPDDKVCHYDFAIIYKTSLDLSELGPDRRLLPDIQKEILDYVDLIIKHRERALKLVSYCRKVRNEEFYILVKCFKNFRASELSYLEQNLPEFEEIVNKIDKKEIQKERNYLLKPIYEPLELYDGKRLLDKQPESVEKTGAAPEEKATESEEKAAEETKAELESAPKPTEKKRGRPKKNVAESDTTTEKPEESTNDNSKANFNAIKSKDGLIPKPNSWIRSKLHKYKSKESGEIDIFDITEILRKKGLLRNFRRMELIHISRQITNSPLWGICHACAGHWRKLTKYVTPSALCYLNMHSICPQCWLILTIADQEKIIDIKLPDYNNHSNKFIQEFFVFTAPFDIPNEYGQSYGDLYLDEERN